jgi:hypothetical protein
MSLQNKLKQIGTAFASVTPLCYHYWRPVDKTPCLIWAEVGESGAANADNGKTEQEIEGSVDLYTKTEYDPLIDDVQTALESLGVGWYLDSVQYEQETNLIHYSWTWRISHGNYQS